MKHILVFLTAMVLMYLSASFINLNIDFRIWSENSRAFYGLFSPLLSIITVFAFDGIFLSEKEVITRDPKTGRFKKC